MNLQKKYDAYWRQVSSTYREVMNTFIFRKLFDSDSVTNAMIASTESKDDLGVVLRLHLITETFLEAFICSAIKNESLFSTEGGRPFKLNYYKKLEFAAKLGLPQSSFKALDKLNTLRNNLAHQIQTDFINDSIIESLSSFVRNIDGDATLPLHEEMAEFFNEDGSQRARYSFKSTDTPNRVKLIILVSSLIRRTMGKTHGFYQLHTYHQFTMIRG